MSDEHLYLGYDDELIDDTPLIETSYSSHWLPYLLSVAEILTQPEIWDPASDVELAVSQAQAMVAQLMGGIASMTDGMMGPIYILGHALKDTQDGDEVVLDSTRWAQSYLKVASPSDGDVICGVGMFLEPGTLTVQITCRTGGNKGKLWIQAAGADSPVSAVFDAYSASGTNNVRFARTIAITTQGFYTIKPYIYGKNASSSNYGFHLDDILLSHLPTAE